MAVIHIDHVFLIKAVLLDKRGHADGAPFRVVAIPKTLSLFELAETLLASFGFELDHSFGYYDDFTNPSKSRESYEFLPGIQMKGGHADVRKARLFRVFTDVGKKMLLLFDFDAGWRFEVILSEIVPYDRRALYPKVIEQSGDPPPQYPPSGGGDDDEA